jgi:hypothetical protein
LSAHSPRNIRVEPAGTFTSRNRAARFVRHGHAEWTDSTFSAIRFFPRFAGANLTSLAAPWRACYRTAEAAVLPPSVDWLKQNYPVFTTESD